MDSILHIASRVEPFIDDWLVDRMEGVGLCLHHPVAREVSFEFNQPWEGTSSIFLRVMKDGDRYRNWYRAGQDADQYPAYAESADGIHWERPDLGLVEFDGSRHNNLLLDLPGIANLCVLRDDNPDAATGERYKAIALGPKVDGRATVRGLVSRDGLQWELLDTDPILVAPPDRWPMFDSPNARFGTRSSSSMSPTCGDGCRGHQRSSPIMETACARSGAASQTTFGPGASPSLLTWGTPHSSISTPTPAHPIFAPLTST